MQSPNYESLPSVVPGRCASASRSQLAKKRAAKRKGRQTLRSPPFPLQFKQYQTFSDAGSILKPGPMVEDRVMRLT